jgi:predicted metal-dependent hydrolase
VQLRLPWSVPAPGVRTVVAGDRILPVEISRHRLARRYVLRVTTEGVVRVTVPRRASIAGGLAFAHSQGAWIAAEWARQTARSNWGAGTVVWYRGVRVALARDGDVIVCGPHAVGQRGDVRAALQARWRAEAARELPVRCRALGVPHGLVPARVQVRNQRSRWGSCSSRGSIALNWRLIQMPDTVAVYVMLHELVHLEQPNHSTKFWRRVASICPDWRMSERWLRTHGRDLL